MQDKDSEALRNQRRRRKRIARMKHTIIAIIAGWIILSMILIIFLLVRTRSMERKLDELWQMQRVMNQQVPDTEALPQEETSGMDTETVAVTAPASGIISTSAICPTAMSRLFSTSTRYRERTFTIWEPAMAFRFWKSFMPSRRPTA